MLFINILIILMCCMVTIVIGSLLFIMVTGTNNIARTRNNIVNNGMIHLNIIRNNTVGIETITAESTICSSSNSSSNSSNNSSSSSRIDCEEKIDPELVCNLV
jgi:hypothetical protein